MYHPPYYHPYHGGMYGPHGPTYIHNDVNINVDRSNNIYNNRKGATTNDVKCGNYNKPNTMDQTRQRDQSGVPRTTDNRVPANGVGTNDRSRDNGAAGGNSSSRQPAAGNTNRPNAGTSNDAGREINRQPATGSGGGNMGGAGDRGFGGRGGYGGAGGGNFGGGGGRMGGGRR